MKLQGKIILLTGASGGIGQAIAKRLAAQGARLILVGRSLKNLTDLAQELNVLDKQGFVLRADITTHEGRETIRTALVALQKPLDALINCAGINLFGMLEETAPQDIEKLLATNVTAPILLTRQVLPFMNSSDGRILNIGSSFGGLGFPGYSTYCASKFALRGFNEALRRELSDSHLQVAYLAPRATKTALNSDAVCAMNRELGNTMDEPDLVATYVETMLTAKHMRDRNIGWPENLFLRINSVFPRVIDLALQSKLPIIRRYTQRNQHAQKNQQTPDFLSPSALRTTLHTTHNQ